MDAKTTLLFGSDYPYDMTDNEEFVMSTDPAIRAARGVAFDLCNRRDIKRGFENVDEDVRKEIICALADIIRGAYKQKDAELARLRDELDRKCIVTRNDDGTATSSCGREWKWVSPYYIGKEHTFYCTKCGGRLFIPPPSEGE